MCMSEPAFLPSPVMIIGVRGFLGRNLALCLAQKGVTVLGTTRGESASPAPDGVKRLFTWDGEDAEALAPLLKDMPAVVNLAGAPLKTSPWTRRYQCRLRESRIKSAAALMAALSGRRKDMRVLQGSAVGFYGDTREDWVDEDSPPGDGFLARLVTDWEAAAVALRPRRVSLALLRTGVVLHPSGGALKRLRRIQHLGLIPLPGGGRQWLAWIHIQDYLAALVFLLTHPEIRGPVNLCAPNPERFAAFASKAVARGGIRIPLRVPAGMMRFFLGTAAEPLLEGQRARPERLREAGFRFKFPRLEAGLEF